MTANPNPGRIVERELIREAVRLFPKLLRDDGHFAVLQRGALHRGGEEAGLFTCRNDYSRPVVEVSRSLVEAFAAKDWLVWNGDRWRLSEAGASWLRRHQAGADPYREQHQLRRAAAVEAGGGVRRPVVINDAESPLGWLRRRKDRNGMPLISAEHYQAGERLREDFARGRLEARMTADWGQPAPSRRSRRGAAPGPAALTDSALAARQRLGHAMKAVGPELAGLLVDICCHLHGLEEAESARGWPRRSGKVVLQIALSRLARHYGLVPQQSERENRRPALRHWGGADYRPSLDRWR